MFMNNTKVNALIGCVTLIVAGVALLLQGDKSLMLSENSMAMIAAFVFSSILLGLIYWWRSGQSKSSLPRRYPKVKKR
jgi:hypothetical protein